MENKKLRMAKIIGRGIKHRCRKESFICITSTGRDDEETLKNFQTELLAESRKYRTWNLKSFGHIFDVTSSSGIICAPLMPEIHPQIHNCIEFDYIETAKS
ncbi:Uncharacterised protein [uncultured archaeon]|nr:Uncharacterised protein [uncultured archaeon]